METTEKKQGMVIRNASCWASPGCHNRCRIAVEVANAEALLALSRRAAGGERSLSALFPRPLPSN